VRAALVTGASTGIGRATVLWLDARGWRVHAGVRREEDMRSLAESGSDRLLPLLLDVTDQEQIEAAAARVLEDTDGAGLDGLVNNAGIAVPGPLETLPIEDFRRQVEVNLTAQVAVTKAMLPSIRSAQGRIVFITSIGGLMAVQMFGAYSAAKFGLEAVGDVFRQELAPWGIGVSIVEPGSIATPIWERGVGEADALLERATEEEKALYPKYLARYQQLARGAALRGIPPEKVAATIEKALTAARPRTRYLVGIEARARALMARFLPDRLVDRLISLATGL
jgi:NAD(P)-dependent dehydrogenase (short-subunit alcohol dehydrogenase family)